ncbi:branched-chain amino acid ABC transporter permease [Hoeflea sp. WL0058]|uniref:Branched-chain amino acid ABC transporter permease n=1 Tax=Flavimaribacter sediminis TaxID=2865987 RepID=A0AAE2ZPW1_9HYPH|nr:branched-chain amino acid ABC transporter permease [Flavimaribacter sediminis]MBW8638670.1 branched-chain amino acid ABC transporter permease [Flavimaribacter sediminis]
MDYIYFLQLTANGLVIGLIYALIAVGLALLFGVLGIVNFAHGELLLIGAYAMAIALPAFGLAYIPGVIVAVLTAIIAGWFIYEVFLSKLGHGEFERSILITMGLSIVILNGIQYIFTATPLLVNTEFGYAGVSIGDIRVAWTRIAAAVLSAVTFAALYVLLNYTQIGRAMRAVSQNRDAALMVGMQPRKIGRNAVILAASLCGLAGAAVAPVQLVQPYLGQFLVFKAFAIIIIGGMGSIEGAVFAAIALGVIESWIGGFFPVVWQEAAGFIIMITVLMLKPSGLFSRGGMRVG